MRFWLWTSFLVWFLLNGSCASLPMHPTNSPLCQKLKEAQNELPRLELVCLLNHRNYCAEFKEDPIFIGCMDAALEFCESAAVLQSDLLDKDIKACEETYESFKD